MSATTHLPQDATNVDVTQLDSERVIDFDLDANSDYEIQSSVIVNQDNEVIEAAVRFGRIPERPHLGLGQPLLDSAWTTMVTDTLGRLDAVEADLSDFSHVVPHLRVVREDVVEYGCETVSLDEFASAVETLAELVESVLRADDRTIDREIDDWL